MTTSPLRNRAAQAGGVGNEVATTEGDGATTVAGLIRQLQPEMQRALPNGLSADRMARLALTAVRQTPKLARCTPQSFAGSLLTAAALGLEVNTPVGDAYLVPYGNECQLIIGYQGLAKLFYNSPLGLRLAARTVYENDDFDFQYGIPSFLKHRPTRGTRGDVVYYYAQAELKTGASDFLVMTPEEVKQLRRGKDGNSGDIPDPQHWMERKTVLRQLLKMMPKSAVLATAVRADEETGSSLYQQRIDQPTIDEPRQLSAGGGDVEGDPVGDQRKATPATVRKITERFVELNIVDEASQARYCSDIVGVEVLSVGGLTRDQADTVAEAQAADLDMAAQQRSGQEPQEDGL